MNFTKRGVITFALISIVFNFKNIDLEVVSDLDQKISFTSLIIISLNRLLRNTPREGDNILDFVLINRENMISRVEVGEQLDCNDHKKIRFHVE